jgi:predicted MFS family arabinose efflux permease
VGYHVFVPVMQAYLGDEVPYRQRGTALAVTEFSWSLSFILGVPLAGLLIKRLGWASPYPVFAILALVGILVLFRLLPGGAPVGGPDRGVLYSLKLVFTSPAALAGLSVSVLMVTANEIINLVFGVWMGEGFGLQITALGAVAIVIGLAEFGGEALAGLADRFGKLRTVALGFAGNILAALGLLFVGGERVAAVVVLLVFYLTFEVTLVSYLPVMTEVLPTARASMMAVNIASFGLGRAIGAPLGAWLYTLAPANLPVITPNAMAAVMLNLAALGALFLLLRIWRPAEEI